jgi:hypothetical protein
MLNPSFFLSHTTQHVVPGDQDAPQNPRLGALYLKLAEYTGAGTVTQRYLLCESRANATLQVLLFLSLSLFALSILTSLLHCPSKNSRRNSSTSAAHPHTSCPCFPKARSSVASQACSTQTSTKFAHARSTCTPPPPAPAPPPPHEARQEPRAVRHAQAPARLRAADDRVTHQGDLLPRADDACGGRGEPVCVLRAARGVCGGRGVNERGEWEGAR